MTGLMAAALTGGPGITVAVSPPQSSGGNTNGNCPSVTAMAAGDTGPFVYSWQVISSTLPLTINSPNSATTNFTFSGTQPEGDAQAVVRVTASYNGQVATADVAVDWLWVPPKEF